jgi:hypothetical protein
VLFQYFVEAAQNARILKIKLKLTLTKFLEITPFSTKKVYTLLDEFPRFFPATVACCYKINKYVDK